MPTRTFAFRACTVLMLCCFTLLHPVGFSAGDPSEIKIVQAKEPADLSSAGSEDDENKRPEHVSKYGTFRAIQLPIEWLGKGIDGAVKGVGKAGSVILWVAEWPIRNKTQGGQHGDEKSKKA